MVAVESKMVTLYVDIRTEQDIQVTSINFGG